MLCGTLRAGHRFSSANHHFRSDLNSWGWSTQCNREGYHVISWIGSVYGQRSSRLAERVNQINFASHSSSGGVGTEVAVLLPDEAEAFEAVVVTIIAIIHGWSKYTSILTAVLVTRTACSLLGQNHLVVACDLHQAITWLCQSPLKT